MDTYYDEILKEVAKLMEQQNYQEAFAVLEDELSMPYIPKASESALVALYNECRSILKLHKVERNYGDDDIEELLLGSLEEQFMAVELLKKSNLRQHLSEVEAYLCATPHILIRSLMIEAMMEQNLCEEIHLSYEGMEITFLPSYVEQPMDSDGAKLAVVTLREWWECEDPSFLTMCVETLIKELYLRLPFNLDEDEAIPLAKAIVSYVFKASDNKEAYLTFLKEQKLTQESDFELLLTKHGI